MHATAGAQNMPLKNLVVHETEAHKLVWIGRGVELNYENEKKNASIKEADDMAKGECIIVKKVREHKKQEVAN